VSRLSRFLHLEKARAGDDDVPAAHVPQRFGDIEPTRAEPEPPVDDPFAPPPEAEIHLQIADAPVDHLREKRRQRAEAELAEARERQLAEQAEAEAEAAAEPETAFGWLGRWTLRDRLIALAVGALGCAIAGELVGPVVWVVYPVLVVVVVVPLLADRR